MTSKEILWNIVNSLLAGVISFGSAMVATGGQLTSAVICVSTFTALTVAVIRFAEYWKKEESEYSNDVKNKIFTFI